MICPPIRQLLGQPNCCIACHAPEPAIPHPTRFEKDGITLLVCEPCAIDYLAWCGELIDEAVARSHVDPRLLIFWSGRH
jgi:hypothetical protein